MRKEKPNYSLKLIDCPNLKDYFHDVDQNCDVCKNKDSIWLLRIHSDDYEVMVVRN